MDVLLDDPRFEQLVTALIYSGLDQQLRVLNADDVTVFAPTNDAFRNAPAEMLQRIYTPGNDDVIRSTQCDVRVCHTS